MWIQYEFIFPFFVTEREPIIPEFPRYGEVGSDLPVYDPTLPMMPEAVQEHDEMRRFAEHVKRKLARFRAQGTAGFQSAQDDYAVEQPDV